VIKAAKVREKAFHSLFVGDVNRLSPSLTPTEDFINLVPYSRSIDLSWTDGSKSSGR
jgi:hypothetical protein